MAALGPSERFQEEATCSICLDFFTDPVMLDCGHNFCRGCISQYWGPLSAVTVCPQCRERVQANLKANRQLASVIEVAKELSVQTKQEAGAGRVCERHQEPLKLFCQEDEAPICVVCNLSKEHRAHTVVPLEEAAQEYKNQICTYLERLRKEREEILTYKADTEKESQGFLKQTEAEKQKMVVEFRQLHQLLEEQEKHLLVKIEEVEKEIARNMDKQMAELSKELSSLENVIQEMEQKCQQSASELLQDVRSTLQRCEKKKVFENPVTFPPAQMWRIRDLFDSKPFLKGIMRQFGDDLVSEFQLQKANVTLDPLTAHPQLILAEDHKSVRKGKKLQNLPNNPERFSNGCVVLGCEGFTAGRHCWEVSMGSGGNWAVGVARKSVKRKDRFRWGPKEGIWAVMKCGHVFQALASPDDIPLHLSGEPQRLRVTLNYAEGQVAFFDADSAAPIYAFSESSFRGQTLLPFFWVGWRTTLTVSPRGSGRVETDEY
ncbi:E3 ubiquitin-protein ligase TRIM39-like [Hemicordylus capensis]|uniref:E3 ubiquitin-protein ligase TRIM39-like n=1 Tax=Hemicordylus capensis TaxID=884348 RepID=UPI002302A0B2|nr:E3 ubiquitin-protein ligase TRIM39-like [Hemicordylus capensis]